MDQSSGYELEKVDKCTTANFKIRKREPPGAAVFPVLDFLSTGGEEDKRLRS